MAWNRVAYSDITYQADASFSAGPCSMDTGLEANVHPDGLTIDPSLILKNDGPNHPEEWVSTVGNEDEPQPAFTSGISSLPAAQGSETEASIKPTLM